MKIKAVIEDLKIKKKFNCNSKNISRIFFLELLRAVWGQFSFR